MGERGNGEKGKDEKGERREERERAALEAERGDPGREDDEETTTRPLAGPVPLYVRTSHALLSTVSLLA